MKCGNCDSVFRNADVVGGVCPECGNRLKRKASTNTLPPRKSGTKRRKSAKPPNKTSRNLYIGLGTGAACLMLIGVGAWAVLGSLNGGEQPAVENVALPEAIESAEQETSRAETPSEQPVVNTQIPPAEPTPEPAPATPKSKAIDLLTQQKIALREDIVERVEAALKQVEKAGYGHVVVGQVEVLGGASPRDVIAQMDILDDGYFVDAVATNHAPVYFYLSGYRRAAFIPKLDQPSGVENVGIVALKPQTEVGGVIKGVLIANDSEVPKEMEAKVRFDIPFINACVEDKERVTIAKRMLTSIAPEKDIEVTLGTDTGAFEIANLPELRAEVGISTPNHGGYRQFAEVSPGEVQRLGVSMIYSARDDQKDVAAPPTEELTEPGLPRVERLFEKLRSNPEILQQLTTTFERERVRIADYKASDKKKKAVVIIGQVKVPGGRVQNHRVEAQMRLTAEGYFAAAVRVGEPVGFRLHGYNKLDYIPKESPDGVDYCGTLTLRKTNVKDEASVSGSVVFEDGIPPNGFRVGVSERIENINWFNGDGGYQGDRGVGGPPAKLSLDTFSVNGLSPISYSLSVSSPGFAVRSRWLRPRPHERIQLAPIFLFRIRNVHLSYLTSKDGDFRQAQLQSAVVSGNSGRWRALTDSEDKRYNSYGNDLTFSQTGNTVLTRSPYAVSYLADLGISALEEVRAIDAVRLLSGTRQVRLYDLGLRSGHVYLLKQWHWKHWVLFRVEDIAMAPIQQQQ